LGFFVADMQIMMGQLHLVAKLAWNKQDIICYKMKQQCKCCCEQLEEQLLECLEVDHLVRHDKKRDPSM
jgi:hypothetical protein